MPGTDRLSRQGRQQHPHDSADDEGDDRYCHVGPDGLLRGLFPAIADYQLGKELSFLCFQLYSDLVLPAGRVVASNADRYRPGFLRQEVAVFSGTTPAVALGVWSFRAVAVGFVLLGGAAIGRRRRGRAGA